MSSAVNELPSYSSSQPADAAASGQSSDPVAPRSPSNAGLRGHVTRDIDGREIRDDQEAVDLKFVLAHSPNVDDEEDDDEAHAAADGVSSGLQIASGSVGEVVTAATSALIESQFQPLDEDDLEYGELDEIPIGQRQRRSSLKHILRSPSTEAPPHDIIFSRSCSSPGDHSSSGRSSPGSGSLHERKAVRFADGPSLEERHELVNPDEPPEVPASALKDLRIRRRKRSQSVLTWTLDFEQPGSDPGFISRVLKDKVALENCIAPTDRDQQLTVSGIIRVANIAYDKHVEVRWTVDGWTNDGLGTYRETAGYMPGSSDGGTDRFAFLICPPPAAVESLKQQLMTSVSSSGTPLARLEFVVSYEAGGIGYWDNNGGRNYGVVVATLNSPIDNSVGNVSGTGNE